MWADFKRLKFYSEEDYRVQEEKLRSDYTAFGRDHYLKQPKKPPITT